MPQEDIQVHSPTSDRKEKDYDASDVEGAEFNSDPDKVFEMAKQGR